MEQDARSNRIAAHPQRRTARLMLSAIAAAGSILYRFPPTATRVYWTCPIHQYTGLLCPGCGGTHAVAALLHGHLAEALHANALVVLALPLLAIYCAIYGAIYGAIYRPAADETRPAVPRLTDRTIVAMIAITLAFAVVRNLTWLAGPI